tara:strand:- start:1528 stop:2553 length:1026 start_codon:yes stop_codon:yes gene_type:complete
LEAKKILIVGAGSIGSRHARNLIKLVEEVKIFSYRFFNNMDIEKLDKVTYVRDLYKAIKSSDAIVIANRTDLHLEVAKYALTNKKHIFIEKPLSHSMLGVKEIEILKNEKKLIIESGFMLRFHPNLIRLKEILLSKEYGNVHYVRSSVGQFLPDWRPQADHRMGYGARRKWGGGVTLDLIHEIDLIRWLFGEVKLVSAMMGFTPKLEIETETISQMNLKTDSGILVQLHLDYLRPSYGRYTEIVCDKGTLLWNYLTGKITFESPTSKISILHEVENDFQRNDMYLNEIKHFIASINGHDQKNAANLDDAIKALKICFAAHLSNKNKLFVSPNQINHDFMIE